jgi:hypothetical protein
MLKAIMAWVEEGRVPDRIEATGKAFPGVSRPLCPYPLVARYKGGDVNSAGSFVCTEQGAIGVSAIYLPTHCRNNHIQ